MKYGKETKQINECSTQHRKGSGFGWGTPIPPCLHHRLPAYAPLQKRKQTAMAMENKIPGQQQRAIDLAVLRTLQLESRFRQVPCHCSMHSVSTLCAHMHACSGTCAHLTMVVAFICPGTSGYYQANTYLQVQCESSQPSVPSKINPLNDARIVYNSPKFLFLPH